MCSSARRAGLLFVLGLSACGRTEPVEVPPSPSIIEARRLLAEAGFPGGKGFPRLEVLYNTDEYHKQIAAAIQEMWRTSLGVTVELRNLEFPIFMGMVHRGEFEIARQGYLGEYNDPHAFLEIFSADSRANSTGWESPRYEELLGAADDEVDPEKRLGLLREAENLLLEDAPLFPIFHYVAHNMIKPFVKGVYPNTRDIHPLQGVTLEGPEAPRDGILIYNGGAEPRSLDPALSQDVAGYKILMHLLEGLVAPDPRDAKPIPALAERWDVSPDGRTYTFHLRPAFWSNGDPVTAEHFVFAWRRVVAPETASTYSHRMYMIQGAREIVLGKAPPESLGVRALDERTLEVRLVRRTPWFLELLLINLFFPVHPPTLQKFGAKFMEPQNAVINGPYRLAEWTLKKRKVFVKNPRYRAAGELKLEKFIFLAVENADTAFNLYEGGQCHWLFRIPLAYVDIQRPDHWVNPYNTVYFYSFNTKKKPLDDRRVRRALSMAVDREKIVKYILRGGETAAERLVPATSLPPRGK